MIKIKASKTQKATKSKHMDLTTTILDKLEDYLHKNPGGLAFIGTPTQTITKIIQNTTNPKTLNKLANTTDPTLQEQILTNKNTSINTIEKILQKINASTLLNIVENPNLPEQTITHIWNKTNQQAKMRGDLGILCERLTKNPNTNGHILNQIAQNGDQLWSDTLVQLIKNPKVDHRQQVNILQNYLNKNYHYLAIDTKVQYHPQTFEEILKTPAEKTKVMLMLHTQTPTVTLLNYAKEINTDTVSGFVQMLNILQNPKTYQTQDTASLKLIITCLQKLKENGQVFGPEEEKNLEEKVLNTIKNKLKEKNLTYENKNDLAEWCMVHYGIDLKTTQTPAVLKTNKPQKPNIQLGF